MTWAIEIYSNCFAKDKIRFLCLDGSWKADIGAEDSIVDLNIIANRGVFMDDLDG